MKLSLIVLGFIILFIKTMRQLLSTSYTILVEKFKNHVNNEPMKFLFSV